MEIVIQKHQQVFIFKPEQNYFRGGLGFYTNDSASLDGDLCRNNENRYGRQRRYWHYESKSKISFFQW